MKIPDKDSIVKAAREYECNLTSDEITLPHNDFIAGAFYVLNELKILTKSSERKSVNLDKQSKEVFCYKGWLCKYNYSNKCKSHNFCQWQKTD